MMAETKGTARRVKAFAPGRTELAGNHTDHQHGHVIAATISQGLGAVVVPNGTDTINVQSAGYKQFSVNVHDVQPHEDEQVSPQALMRGMVAGFAQLGVSIFGFDMKAAGTLPAGGGLSSSAAFELMIGAAINTLCADGQVSAHQLARMAQHAECEHFGKPCGLMDQLAIAQGGIVEMDLADTEKPQVDTIAFDFEAAGYRVCLVDVGCDHSRFTDEYARIPHDMRAVAHLCGASVLREVPEDDFMDRFERIRLDLGDRAALRGMHFYREERLTLQRADALRAGDMQAFLRATELSGASSAQYLQNVFTGSADQPAMVALALAQHLLGDRGACRIHGGGFGGSIQAFVPIDAAEAFVMGMEHHLGGGCCTVLHLSSEGAHAGWM